MPFVNQLLEYTNAVFLETGTYRGDTTNKVLQSKRFDEIITMELSTHYYDLAKTRFQDHDNVKVILGNSRTDLWDVIKDITVPITFWLDAHWSGYPNIGEDKVTSCPLLHELEQIMRHPIKTHTIMIDDIRLMNGRSYPVKKDEIEEALRRINSEYVLTYVDDHKAPNDVLVASIERSV